MFFISANLHRILRLIKLLFLDSQDVMPPCDLLFQNSICIFKQKKKIHFNLYLDSPYKRTLEVQNFASVFRLLCYCRFYFSFLKYVIRKNRKWHGTREEKLTNNVFMIIVFSFFFLYTRRIFLYIHTQFTYKYY